MTDMALLSTVGFMVTFIAMRSFFLFAKPHMMEAQDGVKKSQ